ncbi:MAG: VIT1/CCC1 transporter family protein [Anaerolineae bacterium]
MKYLRRKLNHLKEYQEVAEVGEIARRYFAMNSFDGILTILGVLAGSYLAAVHDPKVIIITGMTTSVSMAVSGLWGAYLTESAERQRSLDDLEEYTLTDLANTRIGRAARVAAIIVAIVDGIAPLLASFLVLLPFFLARLWGNILYSYYAALVIALSTLFVLGMFLGRVSRQDVVIAGLKMIAAGVVALILSYLIEHAVHP